MKINLKIITIYLFVVMAVYSVEQAYASSLQISMSDGYSREIEPEGLMPWATATFVDNGSNSITLTLSTADFIHEEFISVWLFNFDPMLDPGLLSFSSIGTPDSAPISINTGTDAFRAGPDKYYDIEFNFPTSNKNPSDRFTAGETVVYDITYSGAGVMDVSSFEFLSTPGKKGPFHSAVHIQGGIGGKGKSNWVGGTPTVVPEPISSILFISGGAAFAVRRLMKKNSNS